MSVSTLQSFVEAPAFFSDVASKIFSQTEQSKHVLTVISSCLEVIKRTSDVPVLQPLSATFSVVTSFASARGFIGKTSEFISGQLGSPIEIADGVFIPDFPKIMSRASLLVSDICSSMKWLDCAGVIDLAQISASSAIVGTLISLQTPFVVVGILTDVVVISRAVMNEGFSVDSWLKIGANVSKLAFFVFIGSNVTALVAFAFAAGATSSVCTLARFVITEYR